jgi:hypothetical protein
MGFMHFDRKSKLFIDLNDDVLEQLKKTFPLVDVDLELKKMTIWLLTGKGKAYKGTVGFAMNWLKKAAPNQITIAEELDLLESDSPLSNALKDYSKELWKDKEDIFQFNTIKH